MTAAEIDAVSQCLPVPEPIFDGHGCPLLSHWGFDGDPTGMSNEEIEAASQCLPNKVHQDWLDCGPNRGWVCYGDQAGLPDDGTEPICQCTSVLGKPIIYLYPTQTTEVTVSLSNPGKITVSYPAYDDGWVVTAKPNGDLIYQRSGDQLYALYYESTTLVPAQVESDGFVVPGDQSGSFLQEKLAQLGLTPRESQEFIVYWLPTLQANPWNYIRFETAAELDANQQLLISPKPDTLIRVMMTYQPLTEPIQVASQKLPPTPERVGFVVVEWGGTLIA